MYFHDLFLYFQSLILQLKVWYKIIQNQLKVSLGMATEAKHSGLVGDKRPDILEIVLAKGSHIALSKFTGVYTFHESVRDTIVRLHCLS